MAGCEWIDRCENVILLKTYGVGKTHTTKLLIVDELGYVPFMAIGAKSLYEVFSQRYAYSATLVTSNLPLDELTSILGSEQLTNSLLDRFTHHVPILGMNCELYRFATSKKQQQRNAKPNTSSEK